MLKYILWTSLHTNIRNMIPPPSPLFHPLLQCFHLLYFLPRMSPIDIHYSKPAVQNDPQNCSGTGREKTFACVLHLEQKLLSNQNWMFDGCSWLLLLFFFFFFLLLLLLLSSNGKTIKKIISNLQIWVIEFIGNIPSQSSIFLPFMNHTVEKAKPKQKWSPSSFGRAIIIEFFWNDTSSSTSKCPQKMRTEAFGRFNCHLSRTYKTCLI